MTLLDALGALLLLAFLAAMSPFILIGAIIYGVVTGIQKARNG